MRFECFACLFYFLHFLLLKRFLSLQAFFSIPNETYIDEPIEDSILMTMLRINTHFRAHRRDKFSSWKLDSDEWHRIMEQSDNNEKEIPETPPNESQNNNDCSIRLDDHGDNAIVPETPIGGSRC